LPSTVVGASSDQRKQRAIARTRTSKTKARVGDPNSPETLPDRIDIAGAGYLARIPGQGIENQGDYWLHDVHGNTVHYPIVSLPQTITALPRQNALRGKDSGQALRLTETRRHIDIMYYISNIYFA
jgi:hypothetical protein